LNSGAPWPTPETAEARVLGIQRKLHKWAKDDQARRFKALYNLVCDPATLLMAWQRVRGNRGSRSAGVDGLTAHEIEAKRGVEQFLTSLREELRSGTFRPLPVKQRAIPKRNGKLRYLGIPQALMKIPEHRRSVSSHHPMRRARRGRTAATSCRCRSS
jgi:RNA-directed DNA polymerase